MAPAAARRRRRAVPNRPRLISCVASRATVQTSDLNSELPIAFSIQPRLRVPAGAPSTTGCASSRNVRDREVMVLPTRHGVIDDFIFVQN